jgi:H+/Cl- antiporter ClcA
MAAADAHGPSTPAPADGAPADGGAPMGARVVGLLVVAALVGLVVSFAAWGFLELLHQLQVGTFEKLPEQLGYDEGAPVWWPLPVLAVAGLVTALAIVRLPGIGGHKPSEGLKTGVTQPIELPGVVLAAVATIGLGVVLGPEAPLIALGSGLGVLAVRLLRQDAPDQVLAVVAAAGSFAAISFIFGSPLIGAVILIEAAALDRQQMRVVLPTGLLAAGVGSLVSIGMGSWTGLSTSDYALGPLTLPDFARPDVTDFLWTPPLAVAIAAGSAAIFWGARALQPVLERRLLLLLPLAGLAVAGLAIAFGQATDHGSAEVLFSGQDQLPGLVADAGGWSLGALALVIVLKGAAWSISLAGFRGGPTFPGLYLGAAAGVLASHLPGLALTPAVAVGMGAAVVAVLRLPLAAVVLATLLTAKSGTGAGPLVIFGVVVAFITTLGLDRLAARGGPGDAAPPAAGVSRAPAPRPAARAPAR